MAAAPSLGDFEQKVLWTALRLGDEAYGALLIEELERRAGRRVSSGALYATLDRLEGKGLISSRLEDPAPRRGGRRRRYLALTPSGREALSRAREVWHHLWEGLEPELGAE